MTAKQYICVHASIKHHLYAIFLKLIYSKTTKKQ